MKAAKNMLYVCRMLLFLIISQISIQVFAQTQGAPLGKIGQTTATDEKAKLQLALDLVRANEIDKTIRNTVIDVAEKLKFDLKGSEAKLDNKKGQMYILARDRYEQAKEKTINESIDRVAQIYAKTFSSAELKYLIDLTNNPLNKKFLLLMRTEEFTKAMNYPYEKVSIIMSEARKQLKISEPTAPKK